MSTNSKYNQKTAGVIRYSCGALFMLFSFCYLFFLQGDILAQAQFVYSQGVTSYSILGGAIIITVVLQIVQWIVSMILRLPSRVYSLTYLPSALMLALITAIDESTMIHFTFGIWKWLIPVILVFYLVLVIVLKNTVSYNEYSDSLKIQLYPNFIILFVLILCSGSVPRTSDVLHYELKTERLLMEKEWAEASQVGNKSLRTSTRLTQLRMYALSKQDSLADCLFYYPQLYGSRGLLDVNDTASTRRLSARDICLHLGAFCGKTIKSTERYLQLMMADTIYNRHTVDYYLCSFLLDKNMDAFYQNLHLYYNLSDTVVAPYDSLPRAYKEALLMMSEKQYALKGVLKIKGDSLATLSDTFMVSQYCNYTEMKVQIANQRERVNKTHRSFGKTFWWYYDYSDKGEGELKSHRK